MSGKRTNWPLARTASRQILSQSIANNQSHDKWQEAEGQKRPILLILSGKRLILWQ